MLAKLKSPVNFQDVLQHQPEAFAKSVLQKLRHASVKLKRGNLRAFSHQRFSQDTRTRTYLPDRFPGSDLRQIDDCLSDADIGEKMLSQLFDRFHLPKRKGEPSSPA